MLGPRLRGKSRFFNSLIPPSTVVLGLHSNSCDLDVHLSKGTSIPELTGWFDVCVTVSFALCVSPGREEAALRGPVIPVGD